LTQPDLLGLNALGPVYIDTVPGSMSQRLGFQIPKQNIVRPPQTMCGVSLTGFYDASVGALKATRLPLSWLCLRIRP